MLHKRIAALVALPFAAALLASCASVASDAYVVENDPGSVEHVDGSDIGRVTLSADAEKRLGVETTRVTREGRHLAVSDAAIFVDPDGAWWVFTRPEPGVYVRHEIVLERQSDGLALLASGPPAGTEVVTAGVAELYGIEAEVGH
jgi:hypothetical protein